MSPEEQHIHDGARGFNRWHKSERSSLAEIVKNQRVKIDRLRAALENARRDLLGVCPKSAAGGRRKIIKDAVARIEAALNPSPQSGNDDARSEMGS